VFISCYLIGRGPSSPDIGDSIIPPVEPSTSGDSSCSSDISAGNDNNLNGINDNNVDQEFPLNGQQHDILHPMNGHTINFNPLLPPQPVENRFQWVSSTTWQISSPSHPNPLNLPTPNALSLQQPSNSILSPSFMQPNLGSPARGPLAQNGISNPTSFPSPAGIFGGHHTVESHQISRGAKQSRLTAPLPPSNDIPFSQLKRGRKLGQVRDVCVIVLNVVCSLGSLQ